MKPANLRKRGGNSRSVQTLADKVMKIFLLAPAFAAGVFFTSKIRPRVRFRCQKIFQEEQKHANGLYQ